MDISYNRSFLIKINEDIMPKDKLFDRDEVLHKAMELFWTYGFHATSIEKMVNHLGVNRASLYDTYGSKRKLFDESINLYCSLNKNGTQAFLDGQTKVKVGLRKLLEMSILDTIKDTDKKGCFVVNTTTEFVPGDDDMKKILAKNRSSYEKIFYDFLLMGQRSGEIPKKKDLKAIASLIYTLFSGIKVVAKTDPNRKKLLASVDMALCSLD
jgi:TetR/AcrR family transcriptional regulator, transcriptional repressor for nem operon